MTDKLTTTFLIVLGLCMALSAGLYARLAGAAPLGLGKPAVVLDAGPVAPLPPAEAPAPSVAFPDLGADPVGFATSLYEAVRSGRWALVAGALLIGVTFAVRRWVLGGWAWAQTDRGGVVLAGLLALAGALANATLAGTWPDGKALLAALQVALVAMGGYAGLRKLAWPKAAT